MQAGRKILNLRHDREITQRELARACDVTPGALSKIEAGINSPGAQLIWRIAKHLGVTVEYLLDEEMPYPYSGYSYRQELYARNIDPDSLTTMRLSREEKAFVRALRDCNRVAREIAMAIPETPVETLKMMHFLIHNAAARSASPQVMSEVQEVLSEPSSKGSAARKRKKKRGSPEAAN